MEILHDLSVWCADGPVQLPRIEASWMEMYDAMKYLRITISRPEDLPFDVNTIEVRLGAIPTFIYPHLMVLLE